MGIDIANNFQPHYVISEDKEKVVKELQNRSPRRQLKKRRRLSLKK